MSTHHILFSVASGSLEIKLDHIHAVIDGLEAKTGSDFKHNTKVSTQLINGADFQNNNAHSGIHDCIG